LSIRDKILGATRRSETVTVPEWDGVTVTVHAMTARQKSEWAKVSGEARSDPVAISAYLFARCVTDEAGNALFTDADIETVAGLDVVAVERVLTVIYRLNGIGTAAADDAQKK
jgi:hypothetical protein